MSIASEISRLSSNISDSLDAVAAKGVTVPSDSNSDDLPGLIAMINAGSTAIITYEQDSHGGEIIDITTDGSIDLGLTTVTADTIVAGYKAFDKSGTLITGTHECAGGDAPDLQTKSVSFIPTETAQSQTVTPDTGKDGLSSVEVSVGAISSTYVGTGIARKSSTDLTASGATVTVPAGYYSAQASKAVASGSAKTPETTITAIPSISVSASGLITATASTSQSVTPSVSAGYVSSGTAGTVSVSGSNTHQLSTQAATTITPTKASQTAVAAGKYTTGDITVAAIPAAYQDVTGVTATASDVVSGKDIVNSSGTVVHGSLNIQHYYTSANDPTSSDGADGDIWLKVVS